MAEPVHSATAATPVEQLSAKDDAILKALWLYHHMTALQVCRLLYQPTVITYVRSRLKALVDTGYVASDFQKRATKAGSVPLVYLLGRKGVRYLRRQGYAVGRYRPLEAEVRSFWHFQHCLGVGDVLLSLQHLQKVRTELELTDVRHEHQLKPAAVTVQGVTTTVRPDAWFDVSTSTGTRQERLCIALELDNGTEHRGAWCRKVRSLLAFASGPYQKEYGTRSLTVAVVAMPGERRAQQLLRWTTDEFVARSQRASAGLFWFTGLPVTTTTPVQFWLGESWSLPFVRRRYAILGAEDPTA